MDIVFLQLLAIKPFPPYSISSHTISRPVTNMAPRVSDAIKEDHRELEQYYERITQSSDQDEQTRYQNLFTWELARHSIGEELVIYPALEKHVANGKALAEKDRKEHQSVSYTA